jgi:hypothetical protein
MMVDNSDFSPTRLTVLSYPLLPVSAWEPISQGQPRYHVLEWLGNVQAEEAGRDLTPDGCTSCETINLFNLNNASTDLT